MIEPKDKAKELVEKFLPYSTAMREVTLTLLHNPAKVIVIDSDKQMENAKKCALILVEEIIESYNFANVEYEDGKFLKYWAEVKIEIEKL